jgi:predicted MFS family arabinose efflux permease
MRAHSRYRYAVGLGLTAWLVTELSARAFTSAMPATIDALGLPRDEISLPGAVAGLTTTFAAIPMGWLADRLEPKPLLLTGLIFAAAASALALIGGGAMLGLVALLISLAAVLLPPVAVRLLRTFSHDMRGMCLGLLLVVASGGSGVYLLLAELLGAAVGSGWRSVYLLAFAAAVLLQVLITTTFRGPSAAPAEHTAPTLPMRSMLHLSAAATVLASIAGGATQLAGRFMLELRDQDEMAQFVTDVYVAPLPFTVLGAIIAAFLYGPQARWLPRLMLGAAVLCFAALVTTVAAAGTALTWYTLSAVLACGAFAFGGILSTCACWAAENVRGVLTGALFAGKQLLGAICGVVLISVSGPQLSSNPSWWLAVVAAVLCAWSIWHAYRAERALHEPAEPAAPAVAPLIPS